MSIKRKFKWSMPVYMDPQEADIIVEYIITPREAETSDCPGTPAIAEVTVRNIAGKIMEDLPGEFIAFLEEEALSHAQEQAVDIA